HQVGIGEQADRDVLAVLARLLLELRHAVEPAEAGHAVEDPGELGMGRHLALVEDDVLARVDAGGEVAGGDLARLMLQLLRILPDGDGVLVDDAEDAVEAVLQLHPVADGAEIVAEMEIVGGLDAREDAVLRRAHEGVDPSGSVTREGLGSLGGAAVIAGSRMAVKRPVAAGDAGLSGIPQAMSRASAAPQPRIR